MTVADAIQFGAWHAQAIHPQLNGFSGYDTTSVEMSIYPAPATAT